jgi:hypothetical protein
MRKRHPLYEPIEESWRRFSALASDASNDLGWGEAHLCASGEHDRCPGLGSSLTFEATIVCSCPCHAGASFNGRYLAFTAWVADVMATERALLERVGLI